MKAIQDPTHGLVILKTRNGTDKNDLAATITGGICAGVLVGGATGLMIWEGNNLIFSLITATVLGLLLGGIAWWVTQKINITTWLQNTYFGFTPEGQYLGKYNQVTGDWVNENSEDTSHMVA